MDVFIFTTMAIFLSCVLIIMIIINDADLDD